MPVPLNKTAWQKLIDEDIEWLEANTKDSLERQHILVCLLYLREDRPDK